MEFQNQRLVSRADFSLGGKLRDSKGFVMVKLAYHADGDDDLLVFS